MAGDEEQAAAGKERPSVRRALILAVLLVLPPAAYAGDMLMNQPRWSLEMKGGVFAPSLENFSNYYGQSTMPAFALSLAYKLRPQLELGAGVGMSSATGGALAVSHGIPAGRVTYDLFPVNIFILLRAVRSDEQRLIPYLGGGWTRMYYRQTVQNQGRVSGSADGYHVRGGLQLSLNEFDERASSGMYSQYGVARTSFFLEAAYTSAKEGATSTDLGGTATLAGLLFEF
jgi:hypothetical protein